MRSALTKRCLDMLSKLRKKDPEKYQTFWDQFGQVLKEGPGEDFGNREKVAGLLQFSSTQSEGSSQDQSLENYISRMSSEQDKIYYLVADSLNAAKTNPTLRYSKKGIEVILMYDRIDEWLMSYLREFDGKPLQDIARGELDLGGLEDVEEKKLQEESRKLWKA